ncbi:hypothetical protein GC194_05195 [bacterium]|nr:hypothetical protein [bacterium]
MVLHTLFFIKNSRCPPDLGRLAQKPAYLSNLLLPNAKNDGETKLAGHELDLGIQPKVLIWALKTQQPNETNSPTPAFDFAHAFVQQL